MTLLGISNCILDSEGKFNINEFFVFTSNGIKILYKQFTPGELFLKNSKILIKSVVEPILRKNVMRMHSKLIMKPKNIQVNTIILSNTKILFMFKNDLAFVTISPTKTSSDYLRLITSHFLVSFLNFNLGIDESITELDLLTEGLDYKTKIHKNLVSVFLFERYFMKSLKENFEKFFFDHIRHEEIGSPTIKFKNLYIIDLNSQKLIYDMAELCGSKKKQKNLQK